MSVYIDDKILLGVEKPARYTGGEVNSIIKDHETTPIKFAFCFPDVYEVAMSHLGGQILYSIINDRSDALCERIFAPWTDMEKAMRDTGIPLFSLETKTSAREFDCLGFTLQYEMSYTNILNMLDLSGIKVRRQERSQDDPLVCAGGPCAFNPEPLADVVDFFLIGEGEEKIHSILDVLGKKLGKEESLRLLGNIEGIYVPALRDENRVLKVKKVIIKDLDTAPYPEKPIVPYINIVHDRTMIEVFRGCIRGCRFCQAGFIYRPVREKTPDLLVEEAGKKLDSTGYDDISLASLSTSDYSKLGELTDRLLELTNEKNTGLSLPSLRADNFSMELMDKVQKVRKSGLTFAPEAGTQRLRDVINKNVTEEEMLKTAEIAFKGGWTTMKLYFMLGLPTETLEDVKGIADIAWKIKQVYRQHGNASKKQLNLTVSTAFFVPKPFTPFQWEAQITTEEMTKRQQYLFDLLKKANIKYNWHDYKLSHLEGIISRGDRKLGQAIIKAWEKGCRFDGWAEYFNYTKWMEAFDECGIDPLEYTGERKESEDLPWDFIDIGVRKKFLLAERKSAYENATSPNCREECLACGAACFGGGVCFEHNQN
ncbi:MAG: TIGR03960 family B12-binding radical SAM protein [Clostridia bacterium]|nr:TIGR03960 family B12-binding radical SAM protein [Clostridia bacterium]MBN2883493.1 TIGR03960 family B12-binding radical SAM protein [Clostridia bacterium]